MRAHRRKWAMPLMTAALGLGCFLNDQSIKAQQPTASQLQGRSALHERLSFDVGSIRLSEPDTFQPPSFALSAEDSDAPVGGVFQADFPLEIFINFAYKIRPSLPQHKAFLASLPKWAQIDHYTIQARASGNPTKDQMRSMVQSLLAERFGLIVHFETREVPVFALTLIKPDKLGPKIFPHSQGPPCDPPAQSPIYPKICGVTSAMPMPDNMIMTGSRNATMETLAAYLPMVSQLERPVIDRTGFRGSYDYTLQWTRAKDGPLMGSDPMADAEGGITFLAALKEQLGMKLIPATAPMTILVVDHVEKPSAN